MTPSAALLTRRHVVQGQLLDSDDRDVVQTTVQGSCIAACVRDPELGVGGMNHFLLPDTDGDKSGDAARRYGVYAMEVLLNDLLRRGARRERLEAKLFGGARLFDGFRDIGAQNARFARSFLEDEGVQVIGGSVGGEHARRVQYWPVTGRAQQRLVQDARRVRVEEAAAVVAPTDTGDLELF